MLENLSTRLRSIFGDLRGKGKLTEDDINSAMREIRMAMLEADVNYLVVKDFVAKTKTKCMRAEVLSSLTPAQNVIRVVMDKLLAGRDFASHKELRDLGRVHRVFDLDQLQIPLPGIERGLP